MMAREKLKQSSLRVQAFLPFGRTPGFAVPVFFGADQEGEGRPHLQRIKDGKILKFEIADFGDDNYTVPLAKPPEVYVGSDEFFIFLDYKNKLVCGDRRTIEKILRATAKKYDNPYVAYEVAEFIRDKALQEKASRKIESLESEFAGENSDAWVFRRGTSVTKKLKKSAAGSPRSLVNGNALRRPSQIAGLFSSEDVPRHLEKVGARECFYIAGLEDALLAAKVRPRPRALRPYLDFAVYEAKKMDWRGEVPVDDLWKHVSKKELRHALNLRLVTVPRAVMAILAAEKAVAVAKRAARADVYKRVRLIPALSYIHGLTYDVLDEFIDAIKHDKRVASEFENAKSYMRATTGQLKDEVFVDLVRGKTVTRKLANDVLKMIKLHLKGFSGRVDDNILAHETMITDLKLNPSQETHQSNRYTNNICASSAETFRG